MSESEDEDEDEYSNDTMNDKKNKVKILKYYDKNTIQDVPEITWIVDNVIPNNGLIIVYGSPGTGKTFVVLDICLHITNMKPWFENKVTSSGIIVYLIGEGIYGIKKRLTSWMKYHSATNENNDIYFVPINKYNIWEESNVRRLIETMKKFIKESGKNVIMMVVDTLARAATGLDENSSRDMGKFLRNFELVRDKFNCSILFIHHKGKDESRGMRGSSSLLGAADTCIDLSKNDQRLVISIEKQKDGENRAFETKLCKLGDSLVVATKEDMIKSKSGGMVLSFAVDKINTNKVQKSVKWSSEEDESILDQIAQGKTLMEISDLLEKSDTQILRRFRRLITKDGKDSKKAKYLVKHYGIKCRRIIKYVKKHY